MKVGVLSILIIQMMACIHQKLSKMELLQPQLISPSKRETVTLVSEVDSATGRLVGKVIMPGYTASQSLDHSEVAGIFSVKVTEVCEFYSIFDEQIEFVCDGSTSP
jgi:hypothetical protein